MELASVAAFATLVVALFALWHADSLFARSLGTIALQVGAVALLIWAHATFGLRSFHVATNPTRGDLVTTGPCRFLRHPIYASICFFVWAGVLAQVSVLSISLGALATAGAVVRLICEEHLLLCRYGLRRTHAWDEAAFARLVVKSPE